MGLVTLAKLLIEKGASIDHQNKVDPTVRQSLSAHLCQRGETCLFIACLTCNHDVALLLIEKGASLELQDQVRNLSSRPVSSQLFLFQSGNTPLTWACGMGHVALAKLLIEKGASIDHQNKVRKFQLIPINTSSLLVWKQLSLLCLP
jgi:ankyrin repeat protein